MDDTEVNVPDNNSNPQAKAHIVEKKAPLNDCPWEELWKPHRESRDNHQDRTENLDNRVNFLTRIKEGLSDMLEVKAEQFFDKFRKELKVALFPGDQLFHPAEEPLAVEDQIDNRRRTEGNRKDAVKQTGAGWTAENRIEPVKKFGIHRQGRDIERKKR